MLTAAELREILDYNPATGHFYWRVYANRSAKMGQRAGATNLAGYVVIGYRKRTYYAHRLAWLHVHGEWPQGQLDHANRNRSDNRLRNLRGAQPAENNANSNIPKNNSSGYKGVSWYKATKKWEAKAYYNNRVLHLGYFHSKEEAADAYINKMRQLFPGYATTGD